MEFFNYCLDSNKLLSLNRMVTNRGWGTRGAQNIEKVGVYYILQETRNTYVQGCTALYVFFYVCFDENIYSLLNQWFAQFGGTKSYFFDELQNVIYKYLPLHIDFWFVVYVGCTIACIDIAVLIGLQSSEASRNDHRELRTATYFFVNESLW